MTALIVFALAGVLTYAARASMLLLGDTVSSPRIAGRLRLIGPAVLGAIVATSVFTTADGPAIPSIATAGAVAAALVAARVSGKTAYGLAAGFPMYWVAMLVS